MKNISENIARIETKVDMIHELITKINGKIEDHEKRIRTLEKDKSYLFGLASSGLIGSIIALIKSLFK